MSCRDALGNEFKPGMLALVRVGSETMLAQVADVKDGGIIGGEGGLPMAGQLVLQVILPISFDARRPIEGAWVLMQPRSDGGPLQ